MMEVIEITPTREGAAVVVVIKNGEIAAGQTWVNARGEKWRVVGIGFVPPTAHKEGKRALSLAPNATDQQLNKHDVLTQS